MYDGNWKLQAENGVDGYHVTSVHWDYGATTKHRSESNAVDAVRAMDANSWGKMGAGFFAFDNGHLLLWGNWDNPKNRPNWDRRDEWIIQHGVARADWMIRKSRNLGIYPNLFLMDQFSSQVRVFRPLAVDKTEVSIYCIAPKGEDAEARAQRIRQYEDFFNAGGMATPDDLEEFRACQIGYMGRAARWNDLSRGAKHWVQGGSSTAEELGLQPVLSGLRGDDEGLLLVQHSHWQNLMKRALSSEIEISRNRRG